MTINVGSAMCIKDSARNAAWRGAGVAESGGRRANEIAVAVAGRHLFASPGDNRGPCTC